MDYKEYLESHGLDKDYVEKEWGWVFDEGAIKIPVYDKQGDLIHNDYRWLLEGKPKFSRDEGSHPALYGIDKAKNKNTVVYCEGQPDAVRLWQEGIPAVTSDSGAGNLTEHMAALLQDKTVFLCMDSDEAGQKMIEHHYEMISKYAKSVGIVSVPRAYKDVCEMFKAGCSKRDFSALCKDSPRSLDAWRVSNMPDEHRIESLGELFEAQIDEEEWLLDKIVPRVGFAIIAGASAVGKSFLALSIAKAIASGNKWLEKYEVDKPERVLFVDKENERASFKKRARGLKMQDVKDKIYRIVSPEVFDLAGDGKEKFSEFAKDLSAFVNLYDIQLIVFDSLVDFMEGDENSAADTMFFFNAIRELLPGRAILFPAHYTKTSKLDSRTPLERIAGSRNLGAQITSGLAVERSTEAYNELIIQSLKARNAINDTTRMKVLIHSITDPENARETIVTGFQYTGDLEEGVDKNNRAVEVITALVDEAGALGLRRKEAMAACEELGISERTASNAITMMTKSGLFETVRVEGGARNERAIVRKIIKNTMSFHDN